MIINVKILFLFTFLYSIQIQAQLTPSKPDFSKSIDSKKGTFQIGLNGRNYRIINGYTNPVQKLYFPVAGINISYNLIKRGTIGLSYSHQWIWGTNIPKVLNYSFAGAFARYDILRKKNTLFLEGAYLLSNVGWLNTGWERNFPTQYAGFGIGVRTKMYPNIYFTTNLNVFFNLTNSKYTYLVDRRIGITYAFNSNEKDTPLYVENSKKDRTEKWVLGIGTSFMPFDSTDFQYGYNITESTLRLGFYQSSFLSFGLYNRFFIGNSKIPNYSTDYFYFTGPFVNFKLNGLKKWNYFIEMAYLSSNFTLLNGGLTNELPQKGSGQYISTTTGLAYRIKDDLSIELGVNQSSVVKSNTGGSYGAGGYRLGIEKTFKIKKRKTIKTLL